MQSSLAIVLSLTLGFSPHPCVSIFGTGYCMIRTRSFSWKLASMTSVLAAAFHTHHAFAFMTAGFAWLSATSLAPAFPAAGSPSLLRHSFIHTVSTGISTCCPSATPLGLALGPDLPRADEPSSGNLGFSVRGILTHGSFRYAFAAYRTLPYHLLAQIHSFGNILSPGKLSAQSHSTSELLRTL